MDWKDFLLLAAGYLLAEIIRRINRAESFNTQIFNRRLDVFSTLYDICNKTYISTCELLTAVYNNDLDTDYLLEEHSAIVSPLLDFLDQNALFISDELIVHCGACFLLEEGLTKEEYYAYRDDIAKHYKQAKVMIENESGMTLLNKNIKSITKHKHKSDIVDYYNKINKQYKKNT